MKTTKQLRTNRISILFSLTVLVLFPVISNAQITVDVNGKAGVGTINPASVLDAQASGADIRVTSTTGINQAFFRTVNTAGSFYMGLNNFVGNALSNATLPYAACFNHSGAYPINFAIQSKDVMTMLSNGNVGIGTTAPLAKLDLIGTAVNSNIGMIISNYTAYGAGTGNPTGRISFAHNSTQTVVEAGNMAYIEGGNVSETTSAEGFLALGTRR